MNRYLPGLALLACSTFNLAVRAEIDALLRGFDDDGDDDADGDDWARLLSLGVSYKF